MPPGSAGWLTVDELTSCPGPAVATWPRPRAVRRGPARRRGCRPARPLSSGSPAPSPWPGPATRPRSVPVRARHAGVQPGRRSRCCDRGVRRRCSAALGEPVAQLRRPAGRRRPGASPARRRATCWPRRPVPPACTPPRNAPPAVRAARGRAGGGRGQGRGSGARARGRDRDRYRGSPAPRSGWPARTSPSCPPAELLMLAGLMRKLTLAVPLRRSRRQRPHGPRRAATDLRATLRQARRTGGHPFRLARRAPLAASRAGWWCCATSPGRWSRTRGPCSSCCTAPRAAPRPRCSRSPPGSPG